MLRTPQPSARRSAARAAAEALAGLAGLIGFLGIAGGAGGVIVVSGISTSHHGSHESATYAVVTTSGHSFSPFRGGFSPFRGGDTVIFSRLGSIAFGSSGPVTTYRINGNDVLITGGIPISQSIHSLDSHDTFIAVTGPRGSWADGVVSDGSGSGSVISGGAVAAGLGVLIAVILGSNRAIGSRSRDALHAAAGRRTAWRRAGKPGRDHAARPHGRAAGTAGCAIRLAARLMPPAAGRRWLGEAESFLFESDPACRGPATRNYLLTAPQTIAAGWARVLTRRTSHASPGKPAGPADDSGGHGRC